jgi:hypothetical protein
MRKRAAIEFSVHWESRYAIHNDRSHIDKIDFWRDIFPGSMGEALQKLDIGQSQQVRGPRGSVRDDHLRSLFLEAGETR